MRGPRRMIDGPPGWCARCSSFSPPVSQATVQSEAATISEIEIVAGNEPAVSGERGSQGQETHNDL